MPTSFYAAAAKLSAPAKQHSFFHADTQVIFGIFRDVRSTLSQRRPGRASFCRLEAAKRPMIFASISPMGAARAMAIRWHSARQPPRHAGGLRHAWLDARRAKIRPSHCHVMLIDTILPALRRFTGAHFAARRADWPCDENSGRLRKKHEDATRARSGCRERLRRHSSRRIY